MALPQNDPLQNAQINQPGLQLPNQAPDIDWSTFKPLPKGPQSAAPAAAPAPSAAQPGQPDIDWSTFKPAGQPAAPAQPEQDQGIIGNAVDYADKYLTRKSSQGGLSGLLAEGWQYPLGFAKGAMDTLHFAGAASTSALKNLGVDVPEISFDEPQYLEAHGAGQTIGKIGEGVLEFFMGDEALKGASMAEKLKQATKLAEFMESSPRLAAALTTGIGALRMGAVSAAGTAAHGGSTEDVLTSGLETGAIGGALGAFNQIAKVTANPMLAKAATGAEIATGAGIAGRGAVSALTPAQPGETPQQSLERRVNGVVQGILGVYGAKTAAGEASSNVQAARGRQTAKWLDDIEKDVFWASPTSQGKTAGATPEAKTYRETIRAALPQLLEVVKDHPTASTPKEMSRAIQTRIDGVEGRLQRVAESTAGYDNATLSNVEDDFRDSAKDFYDQNKGKYNKKEFDTAVDDLVNHMRQGEGAEPRDPNLFEGENIRQQWNAELGEAPDRSTPKNALKEVGVKLLRDKIDQGYEDLGIENVKEWRKQESNLIRVKDQIQLGEKAMEKANKTPLLSRLLRSAGWAGIGTLFGGPFGTAVGVGGIGLEVGPIVRDYMENRENNPETRIARIQSKAGKLAEGGYKTGAITPDFTGQAQPAAGITPPKALPASDLNATAGMQNHIDDVTEQIVKSGVSRDLAEDRARQLVEADSGAPNYNQIERETAKYWLEHYAKQAGGESVIRDTGSLRNTPPPEAPPEIQQALTGTGLEYLGSDSMGLSHFHDPRTNNTYSLSTDKVSQDELFSRMAQKAALTPNTDIGYQIKPDKAVEAARKNHTAALKEYDKAKRESQSAGMLADKLAAQKSVREAAQKVVEAEQSLSDFELASFRARFKQREQMDKEYVNTFTPEIAGDVPHFVNPHSTNAPIREIMSHEYGHAAAEVLIPELGAAGFHAENILSHNHPDVDSEKGALASTRMNYGKLVNEKGDISIDTVRTHIANFVDVAALGGATEELLHGTKVKENRGLVSDIKYMRFYMDALKIPKTDQKVLIDRAFDRAKERLQQPGVLDIIKKYSNGREPRLSGLLHASGDRIKAMNEELRNVLENPNEEHGTRPAGQGNENDQGIAARTSNEAAGVVPPANASKAGSATSEAGKEIAGQTVLNRGIIKPLGVATGLGALAGTALKAQEKLPEGMVAVGNIDVNHRPVIHNANGSVSTIFSVTVPIGDGNWALIPSIVDGKFLTPDGKIPNQSDKKQIQELEDRAYEHYKKTGEHLGIFKSLRAADDFAETTHDWLPTGGKEKVFLPVKRAKTK